MTKFLALAAVALGIASAPAIAVPLDAFSAFNGTNGNGSFVYGVTDSATLTAFNSGGTNGACALGNGSTCLYASALGNLPQASIGGSYPTIDIPANAVLFHPGNDDSQSVYGAFVATTASAYNYTIDLKSVGNDTTTGVGYTPFTSIGGVLTLGTRGVLPTYLSTATLSGSTALAAGQQFGVIIDRNGSYIGDSTSVNITVSTVPEPATWGLMIVGFGMVGAAARRRSATVAA